MPRGRVAVPTTRPQLVGDEKTRRIVALTELVLFPQWVAFEAEMADERASLHWEVETMSLTDTQLHERIGGMRALAGFLRLRRTLMEEHEKAAKAQLRAETAKANEPKLPSSPDDFLHDFPDLPDGSTATTSV